MGLDGKKRQMHQPEKLGQLHGYGFSEKHKSIKTSYGRSNAGLKEMAGD
jgi:hypothetical protein